MLPSRISVHAAPDSDSTINTLSITRAKTISPNPKYAEMHPIGRRKEYQQNHGYLTETEILHDVDEISDTLITRNSDNFKNIIKMRSSSSSAPPGIVDSST